MLLIGSIRLYRATLSGVLGGQCRFEPSCSVYAEQAVRNRGALAGSALAVWRIVRCSPLSRGGVDPAPAPPPPRPYDGIIRQAEGAPS
ncbi:MAG: membrane protein insertion efficiency factor YidD [Actinomycetota bacterium]|nr:membrane protein insertion efficiency factor YidD [Actinomycetota bacterium]